MSVEDSFCEECLAPPGKTCADFGPPMCSLGMPKADAPNERMTCWVPDCRRTHLLGRDGAGWWWCWRHWWSRKLWSRILPAEVKW